MCIYIYFVLFCYLDTFQALIEYSHSVAAQTARVVSVPFSEQGCSLDNQRLFAHMCGDFVIL